MLAAGLPLRCNSNTWNTGEISATVVRYIAEQLSDSPSTLVEYTWCGRTAERHRADIRKRLDFRKTTIDNALKL